MKKPEKLAIGTRVRATTAFHQRLGAKRKRDPNVQGTVVGYVVRRNRTKIEWDKPKFTEALRDVHFEEVIT